MCGIAAIFAYHRDAPPVDAVELGRINDAMARRGPDGEGTWIAADGRTGLAHRRLAIIDLSDAGRQPMAIDGRDGREKRFHITYNGEIYNYRTLRDELESAGIQFFSQSDTEVLLRLYERDGPAMLDRLRGMFTIAIHDARERTLFLARDPYGIKPLYFSDDGAAVRVASQVKALLAGGKVDTSFDAAGHAGFFLFGSVPEPHTLFKGIRALGAGEWLLFGENGDRRAGRYFDVAQVLARNGGEPAADFRRVVLDSVAHHFVSDVPVGVFLSAGLDSTAITGLAAECRGAGLETITLGFDEFADGPCDEVPLAEQVARAYSTRQSTERISRKDFEAAYDDILAVMDQPSVDGVNTYFVARAAARKGLKVALSGLGGDELLGGYDTFSRVPAWVSRIGRLPGHAGIGAVIRQLARPFGLLMPSPKAPGLIELGGSFAGAYLLARGLFMPWELPRIMDPDMARQGLKELDIMRRLEEAAAGPESAGRKVAVLEACWYMRNQLLRDADWAGMAHSLEIRVPLVDRTVLETLSPTLFRNGGPDKRSLAAAPVPPLPPAVRDRPKSGFFIPVQDWLSGRSGSSEPGLRGWARAVYSAATTPPK